MKKHQLFLILSLFVFSFSVQAGEHQEEMHALSSSRQVMKLNEPQRVLSAAFTGDSPSFIGSIDLNRSQEGQQTVSIFDPLMATEEKVHFGKNTTVFTSNDNNIHSKHNKVTSSCKVSTPLDEEKFYGKLINPEFSQKISILQTYRKYAKAGCLHMLNPQSIKLALAYEQSLKNPRAIFTSALQATDTQK